MADEPFPPDESTQVPTSIGDCEWVIIMPHDDSPRARYSVQILDQNGVVMDVKNGVLFEVGGTDHLRTADKQAIISMDAYLRTKATTAWIPSP